MLPSGNDAAIIISDNLGAFLSLLNEYDEDEVIDILYDF